MAKVWTVESLSLEKLNDSDVMAQWKFQTGSTTDHFNLWWEWWSTELKIWVLGSASAVSVNTAHYEQGYFQESWTPPSDPTASNVRVWIDPVPTSGSGWSHKGIYSNVIPNPSWQAANHDALDAPSLDTQVELDGRIVVSWDEPPALAEQIVIYQSLDGGPFERLRAFDAEGTHVPGQIVTGRFFSVRPGDGHTYCWSGRWCLADGKTLGLESDATDVHEARPLAPTDMMARAVSGTSVRLDWVDHGVAGSEWRIEYSDDPSAWDNHAEVEDSTRDDISPDEYGHNWATVDGLESGTAYWFRLVRTNDTGDSDWGTSGTSVQVRCVAGTTPEAPSPGAVPSCAPVDEALRLPWTHNSEDGSSQTAYEVEINGTTTLSGTTASSVTIYPGSYGATDGGTLTWRVRTKGAVEDWSEWSNPVAVTTWARPLSTIGVASTVSAYPITISLSVAATAVANAPTRMWLSIANVDGHRGLMRDGTERWIPAGTEAWSAEATVGEDGCTTSGWTVTISAADAILDSGEQYVVQGGCMTAQGMVSEAEPTPFDCSLSVTELSGCDCDATLDREGLFATVYPRCSEGPEGGLVQGVSLSVWRVTPDGNELIAEGLVNDGNASCVDRHPSFGSCTYRVVAASPDGSQGASDATFSWKGPGIVIQWDEGWSEPSNGMGGVEWSGSRLVLPYNVDVSEQWDKESSLNLWAGNRHPVSRYGTQVGHTATWSCVLNKYERDGGLDEVRALAAYMGDVHVREPYGSSYWAHVQVALQEMHGDAAIPVTLTITRVEA